jgi:hypothetical protein
MTKVQANFSIGDNDDAEIFLDNFREIKSALDQLDTFSQALNDMGYQLNLKENADTGETIVEITDA